MKLKQNVGGVYIAAPFFNPAQLAMVQTIEKVLDEADVPYFSPRKQYPPDRPPPKITTRDQALPVLELNKLHLGQATVVLAVLDYPGVSTHVVPDVINPTLVSAILKELPEFISMIENLRRKIEQTYSQKDLAAGNLTAAEDLAFGLQKAMQFCIPPAVLPDAGTIWECGYATARKIPVIGVCNSKKLNLMLSASCIGFVTNTAGLQGLFRPDFPEIADEYLEQYNGHFA